MLLINKKKKEVTIPGSWMLLCLVMLIFFSKYYLGYKQSEIPNFMQSAQAIYVTLFTSGFSMGILVGRLAQYLYCYFSKV